MCGTIVFYVRHDSFLCATCGARVKDALLLRLLRHEVNPAIDPSAKMCVADDFQTALPCLASLFLSVTLPLSSVHTLRRTQVLCELYFMAIQMRLPPLPILPLAATVALKKL